MQRVRGNGQGNDFGNGRRRRSGGQDTRTQIDAEGLAVWAFRDQKVDRLPVVVAAEQLAAQSTHRIDSIERVRYRAELGVRVDSSMMPTTFDAHSDAVLVYETVAGRLDPEARWLVTHHAHHATRPDWVPDPTPKWRPLNGWLTRQGRQWGRLHHAVDLRRHENWYVPVYCLNDPWSVRMKRYEYALWWLALRLVGQVLAQGGGLRRWELVELRAPREPWAESPRKNRD